ncbi:type II toxin-antitoxin system VapC family toxin [Brevundimonas sp.]|uniref:type II toxin-antitoxin system VapC family toxin n=1 Tax=Brevundimonas sp. TaxID=1871086 RepID=UPI003F72C085
MNLCLDANVLIEALRRRQPVLGRWQDAVGQASPLILSSLVLHELEAGADLSARPAIHRARLHELLAYAEIVEFDADDARVAGRVRAKLQRLGRPIGPIDTLIAGQALARGWAMVTRNVRHFGRINGLPLIDWSIGTDRLSVEVIASRVGEAD